MKSRHDAARASPGEEMPAAPPAFGVERAGRGRVLRVSTQWRLVRAAAERQLANIERLEPVVLSGDSPEAIHDLRVASRRLQQVFDLLYPAPLPPKLARLRRTIRRSRRALSEVRNCDVLLEHARRVLRRKHVARRETWETFLPFLDERRRKRFERAAGKLRKLKLGKFRLRVLALLPAGLSSGRAVPAASEPVEFARPGLLGERLRSELASAWATLKDCLEKAHAAPATADLHAVRIAGKKVRYLVEVLMELKTAGAKRAVECLKQTQQLLGDWHDLEVLEERLLMMVSAPGFLKRNLHLGIQAERAVLRIRRRKKICEERFLSATVASPRWQSLEAWMQWQLQGPAPGGAAEEPAQPARPPRPVEI